VTTVAVALSDEILDEHFRSAKVALYKGSPFRRGQEVSGVGYERQLANFSPASEGRKWNLEAVAFGPAASDWGAIDHFALFSFADDLLLAERLTVARLVRVPMVVEFAPRELEVVVHGGP